MLKVAGGSIIGKSASGVTGDCPEDNVVTLSGVVDRQADKDTAGMRANGVPGVFKVTNDLQVAEPADGK